jgi:hypothetical protein
VIFPTTASTLSTRLALKPCCPNFSGQHHGRLCETKVSANFCWDCQGEMKCV